MEIALDIRKTIDENAVSYFETAKKAKKKLKGAQKALEKSKIQLYAFEKQELYKEVQANKIVREKKWYEKFRWFFSSEGFLCIGGRDATSNEIVVKKHTDKDDIVFHTEMSGSPFFIIKSEGKTIGQDTLDETAIAVASFSRAWRLQLSHAEVFYVKPDQLSRTPKPGEFLKKGSFIVKGHTTKRTVELKLAIGLTKDGVVMCAPLSAVQKNCEKHLDIKPGNVKSSDIAKKVMKKIGGEIDDIVRVLPSGGCKIV